MALFDVGMKVLDKFIPDPEAKAKAQKELLQMQQEGKLAELNADMNEQNNVSDRWKADLGSDSWLSKNIRPMSLVAIFAGYFLFAMMSAFGYDAFLENQVEKLRGPVKRCPNCQKEFRHRGDFCSSGCCKEFRQKCRNKS